MPRPSLENIRGLPDFQTVYNWNIHVSRAPALVPVPANFNFMVQTSIIPAVTNSIIDIDIRGHKVHQPGINQYDGTLDLQVVETVDSAMARFLKAWRELQWQTNTGIAAMRNDSSVDLQLQLLDRQDRITRTFTMLGGILGTYNLGDLSGDGSDIIRPTLTVTYDYFKED